jgi:hypothetical protein
VGKGSRQNRSVTSGKRLALVVEFMGLWKEVGELTCWDCGWLARLFGGGPVGCGPLVASRWASPGWRSLSWYNFGCIKASIFAWIVSLYGGITLYEYYPFSVSN